MQAELLLEQFKFSRGFIKELPDHELLTLIGRLATDYVVRKGGANESVVALGESVGAGVWIGRSVLDAQRIVRERAN